jgi:hypothetical protein
LKKSHIFAKCAACHQISLVNLANDYKQPQQQYTEPEKMHSDIAGSKEKHQTSSEMLEHTTKQQNSEIVRLKD